MKITPHFSVEEFACKDGTPYPPGWVETRLRPLCHALERLRERLGGRPITIISGYRTENYNRRVGGARASQHVQGRAADITCTGVVVNIVHEQALQMHEEWRMLQARPDPTWTKPTARLGGLGAYPNFTHVDIRPGRLKRWRGSRRTT